MPLKFTKPFKCQWRSHISNDRKHVILVCGVGSNTVDLSCICTFLLFHFSSYIWTQISVLSTTDAFKTGFSFNALEGNYQLFWYCVIARHSPHITRLMPNYQCLWDTDNKTETDKEREKGEVVLMMLYQLKMSYLRCWDWDSTVSYLCSTFMNYP